MPWGVWQITVVFGVVRNFFMYKYMSIYMVWSVCHWSLQCLVKVKTVQKFVSHHSGSLLCLHLGDWAEWLLHSWQEQCVWIYKFPLAFAWHPSPLPNPCDSAATCNKWNKMLSNLGRMLLPTRRLSWFKYWCMLNMFNRIYSQLVAANEWSLTGFESTLCFLVVKSQVL